LNVDAFSPTNNTIRKTYSEENESNSQQSAAIPAGSESEEESFEDESGHSVSLGQFI